MHNTSAVSNSVLIGGLSGNNGCGSGSTMIGASSGNTSSNASVTGAGYFGFQAGQGENRSNYFHFSNLTGISVISANADPGSNTVYLAPITFSGINLPAVGTTVGGNLPANTYYYRLTGVNGIGETLPSLQSSAVVTGSTSSVTLTWPTLTGFNELRIYRGTSNGIQTLYYTVSGTSFTDTNSPNTIAGVPPTMTRAFGAAISPAATSIVGSLFANGTRVPSTYIYTATLDFGSTAAGTFSDLTIAASGAVLGDIVDMGIPNVSMSSAGNIGIFTAWVSATDVVSVRFMNANTVAAIDPASGVFKVSIIR